MNRLVWRMEVRDDPGADWLGSNRVVRPDGRVWSWVNPAHPGHPYPEAAALWLSWAAWRGRAGLAAPPRPLVSAVWQGLAEDLERQGAVGRGGVLYLFDTCVAVAALAQVVHVSGRRAWLRPALVGLERFAQVGYPVLGQTHGLEGRWSARLGPHLIKAAALLLRAWRALGETRLWDIAAWILARVGHPGETTGQPEYSHALAYAAEGACLLRALEQECPGVSPEATAERFALLQRDDGSLSAFLDGSGPARADTTAQAVRLWAATDPMRYGPAIEAALTFLDKSRAPEGGIRYEPGSEDLCTWATIFADQARTWARGVLDPLDWI